MEALRPNAERAKMAIVMLWVVFGIEVVSLVSDYMQYDLLNRAMDGEYFTDSEADANDLRAMIVGLLYAVVYIISAIIFIRWFRRAYFNLHQLFGTMDHTEGWAAGAWFVPIISLFRPYQIMKEMYQKTKRHLADRNLGSAAELPLTFVGWWWTFWIINNIYSSILTRVTRNAETLDSIMTATQASMINSLLSFAACLLAIKVVSDYARAEEYLHSDMHDDEILNVLVE